MQSVGAGAIKPAGDRYGKIVDIGLTGSCAVNRLCAQRNGALQHLIFAAHYNYVMLRIDQGGTTCRNNAAQKEPRYDS
jgi:hypothetical protein